MFTTKYSKNRNEYKGKSKKVNKKKFAGGGFVESFNAAYKPSKYRDPKDADTPARSRTTATNSDGSEIEVEV
jgi:hypothetical protein